MQPGHVASTQSPEGVQHARAEVALGVCLLEQGRLGEAETLLVGAREALEAGGAGDPYLNLAENALAALSERQGRR